MTTSHTNDHFVELDGGSWVGTAPNPRYPVWTRGNAGEVFPDVMTPLSFSLAWAAGEAAFQRSIKRNGGATDADFAVSAGSRPPMGCATGVFGGYSYLNLSFARVLATRLPGATIEDVDTTYMGEASAPPHVEHSDDKNLRASLRSIRHVLRTLSTKELPQLEDDKTRITELQKMTGDLATTSDQRLRDLVDIFLPLFEDLFDTHLTISGQAGVAVGALTKFCTEEFDDPSMAVSLLAGIGDVESAAPAAALWDLGRIVADDADLSSMFDQGVDGLFERLVEADHVHFLAAFSDFLTDFGSRGPNEWDTAADTWGTRPALALALVDRMRGADPSHDPRVQQPRLAAERAEAEQAAIARLGRLKRAIFRKILRAARLFSQGRERSKTTVIKGIHEQRRSGRELARRVADRSGGDVLDMWFVTIEELDDYIADPGAYSAVIADRRAMHDRLAGLEPPFFFEGESPPLSEWASRDRHVASVEPGDVLTGLPGCPGVARGTARVVIDPSDPGALGPGDVLVAPLTDPSWTPLFVPAEAVVVDVGAVMSHAVIVSRELGIPCVVSVTDATRSIPDGAEVEVDGRTGTVTVLTVPSGA